MLLKNEGGILPLKRAGKIAVLGAMAEQPRYQGGGSSHVASWRVENTLECIRNAAKGAEVCYAPGYTMDDGAVVNRGYLDDAIRLAGQAEQVIVFIGLPEQCETEGSDRTDMTLPAAHNALAEAILAVRPDAVIVLTAGAPTELPWADRAHALLNTYTAGDGLGAAVANILFGAVNPSGKLAETFPVRLEHTPAYLNFQRKPKNTQYAEGVFVGYRWYEKRSLSVLFPFGHGLSYTSFDYTDLHTEWKQTEGTRMLQVSASVRNTGDMAGKEVVQLYVAPPECGVVRPVKELKAFAKILLQPGEARTVTFTLPERAFAFYDSEAEAWAVEPGTYELCVGASSADIRLHVNVTIPGKQRGHLSRVTKETTYGELADDPRTYPLLCRCLKDSPMYRPDEMPDAPEFLRNLPLWTLDHMAGRPITPDELEDIICAMDHALEKKQLFHLATAPEIP